jgi:hypothetical protein
MTSKFSHVSIFQPSIHLTETLIKMSRLACPNQDPKPLAFYTSLGFSFGACNTPPSRLAKQRLGGHGSSTLKFSLEDSLVSSSISSQTQNESSTSVTLLGGVTAYTAAETLRAYRSTLTLSTPISEGAFTPSLARIGAMEASAGADFTAVSVNEEDLNLEPGQQLQLIAQAYTALTFTNGTTMEVRLDVELGEDARPAYLLGEVGFDEAEIESGAIYSAPTTLTTRYTNLTGFGFLLRVKWYSLIE